MEEVREATGGNIEVMGKLFGNVRALNGVMALANDNFESMAKITGDVATKTGQTSEALSNQADTVNFKFGKLMSNLTNFAIRVGSILAPIAKLFLNVANGILKGFNAVFDAITVHQEEKQEELVTGLQFVVDEIGESQLAVTEVMKKQAELRTANEAGEQKKRLALASDLAIKKLAKASEVDKKKKELLKNELALYKGFIKNISDLDRSELEQKIKGLDELKEKNKRNADAIKKIESESSKFREELRRREEKVGTEFLNFFAESVRNRTLSLEEMGKHVGKMIQKQLTARIVAEKAVEVGSLIMKAWGTFGASLLGIPLVIGEAAATIAAINAVQFQDGGIVQPSAGGTPMNIGGTPGIVGEAAQPEVVMPLDQLIDLFPTELILTNENGDTLAKAMWNQQKILQRTGEIT